MATSAEAEEAFRTVGLRSVGNQSMPTPGKLKWLPYRPSMPTPKETPAQSTPRVAQTSAKAPTKLVQHSLLRPFEDPFGDGGAKPLLKEPSPDTAGKEDKILAAPRVSPASQRTLDTNSNGDDSAYSFPTDDELKFSDEDPLANPNGSSLADELGAGGPDLDYKCPSLNELKPIGKITYHARPKAGELPRECTLVGREFEPRHWACTTYHWKASGLCHKPLYFEDVHLERYGHSWGPYLQPVLSGAHFFATVPILPYKMGMYPPYECMYTLGYYRPGSCAPYMLDPIPLSVRGALAETGAVLGASYIIP
jgi:hypothetical protein